MPSAHALFARLSARRAQHAERFDAVTRTDAIYAADTLIRHYADMPMLMRHADISLCFYDATPHYDTRAPLSRRRRRRFRLYDVCRIGEGTRRRACRRLRHFA